MSTIRQNLLPWVNMTEFEIRDLFGYNLKRLRKLRNISQMQLAEKVDMGFTFINAVENGKKWVSPESIAKFTEALNIEAYQRFASVVAGSAGAFVRLLHQLNISE